MAFLVFFAGKTRRPSQNPATSISDMKKNALIRLNFSEIRMDNIIAEQGFCGSVVSRKNILGQVQYGLLTVEIATGSSLSITDVE